MAVHPAQVEGITIYLGNKHLKLEIQADNSYWTLTYTEVAIVLSYVLFERRNKKYFLMPHDIWK